MDTAGIGFRCTGAGIVEESADPAGGEGLVAVAGGFPNFSGAEMATVRVGVADVLDKGEVSGVVEAGELGACRVEGEFIGEGDALGVADGEIGPEAVVVVVLVGDKGIEAVITTGELDEDEDGAVFFGRGRAGEDGLGEEARGDGSEGDKAEAFGGAREEFSSGGGEA